MNLTPISQAILTMTSREIAELVESRHDSVKRSMETLRDKGVISFTQSVETSHDGAGSRPVDVYLVNKRDSYIVVAQLSPEFTAKLVDRWQELENQKPAFDPSSLTRLDILKLAMDSEQGRIKAESERDQAIATKHLIGSKREATAMATASAAKREVARLKDQLGFSVRQATILQVESAMGCDFDFLPLRRWCNANEIVADSVPDKRYPKGVKAWPAAAWLACYGIDLAELFETESA
jgi:phage regulator Rha-like protein